MPSDDTPTPANDIGNYQEDAEEHTDAEEPIQIIDVLARNLDIHTKETT